MSKKEGAPSGASDEPKSNIRSLHWARYEKERRAKEGRDEKPDDGPLLEGPTAEERQKKAREEQLENTKRIARDLKSNPKKGRGPNDRRH